MDEKDLVSRELLEQVIEQRDLLKTWLTATVTSFVALGGAALLYLRAMYVSAMEARAAADTRAAGLEARAQLLESHLVSSGAIPAVAPVVPIPASPPKPETP